MATLTILTSTLGDQDLTAAAASASGDQFLNDGRVVLYFKNTNASDRTITIVTAGTVNGLAIADVTLTISQDEEKIIGPFPPRVFNDGNGYVQLTYSAHTNLTVRPIRVT